MKAVRFYQFIFGLLFIVLLSACGGSSSALPPVAPTPDFSLSLSNAAPSFTTGGNATVTVTISPTGGFTDNVALSISSPADVTANFSPASTTTTSTLTLTSNTAGSYPMTVTGTSGALTRTANLTLTVNSLPAPTTITVSGRVTGLFGQPLANHTVRIGASVTASDVNGDWSISNVTAPYEAAVFDPSDTNRNIVIYQGLTRTDPTLQYINFGAAFDKSATVNGNLSGGAGYPNPVNHRSLVAFDALNASGSAILPPFSGPAYSVSSQWSQNNSISGAMHALQWEVDGSGLPSDYKGYGSTNVSLSDGGTFTGQNITLSGGVSETSTSGTINMPAGYIGLSHHMMINFGSATSYALFIRTDASFAYTMPDIPGVNFSSYAQATSPSGGTSISVATNVGANASLTLPPTSTLTTPTNGSTNIDHTSTFNWTAVPNSISVMFANSTGPASDPDYIIVAEGTSTQIPEISGFSLPAGTTYNWEVVTVSPFTSSDDAAASLGALQQAANVILAGGTYIGGNSSVTQTSSQTFTTTP